MKRQVLKVLIWCETFIRPIQVGNPRFLARRKDKGLISRCVEGKTERVQAGLAKIDRRLDDFRSFF